MRHTHADLIHKWADGAQIQCLRSDYTWVDALDPSWLEVTQYRIKPEPKPDVDALYYASIYSVSPAKHFDRIPNLKLTFDVETCELKAAEVMT
jgi:hypothetical protein